MGLTLHHIVVLPLRQSMVALTAPSWHMVCFGCHTPMAWMRDPLGLPCAFMGWAFRAWGSDCPVRMMCASHALGRTTQSQSKPHSKTAVRILAVSDPPVERRFPLPYDSGSLKEAASNLQQIRGIPPVSQDACITGTHSAARARKPAVTARIVCRCVTVWPLVLCCKFGGTTSSDLRLKPPQSPG